MADQELDARGMTCPLPVMRAAKIMLAMKAGQTLPRAGNGSRHGYENSMPTPGARATPCSIKKTAKGDFEFLLKRA